MSLLPCSDILVTKCSCTLKAVFHLVTFQNICNTLHFLGLSCLWRIMLHHAGNSFEELRNQMRFFPTLEQELLQSARRSGFATPSLPKPDCEARSESPHQEETEQVTALAEGDIPCLWWKHCSENNNLCLCLKGRQEFSPG